MSGERDTRRMPRRAPSTSSVRGGRQRPPSHRLQSAEASPLAGPAAAAPVTPVRPAPTAADLAEAAFQTISRVKVTPTPHREATLSRARLLDWLRDHARQRLSLVIAEAGYGKTTLLADFSRRGEIRCLWYKLDSTDGDWVTFLNYLIASAREAVPEFARATTALLGQMAVRNPPRELVIATFMAELGQLGDEPTVWIFDDFHVVDESEDVREIVTRLLRDAPESVQICLVTRRRPDLVLGRLAAQGQLAELDTPAMRFSLEETGHLFEDVYGQPLEPDVLRQVEERTQGWAASLQLLNSSIRGRSRTEVRAFVRVMSGAEGPLYDFLAEEVMNELPPDLKRFLLHASLLERITEDYVAAAMERNGERPTPDAVRAWIAGATDLGLLGRVDPVGRTRQLHPLLRDFLRHEVASLFTDEEVASVHSRVAAATTPADWLMACRHHIGAGETTKAVERLSTSMLQAFGTGAWGSAAEVLVHSDGVAARAELLAIAAVNDVYAGRAERALTLLEPISTGELRPLARAIVRHTRMKALWRLADTQAARAEATEALKDSTLPAEFREIARAYVLIADTAAGGPFRPAIEHILQMADIQARAGLSFFAGVSFHNAMTLELASGRAASALEMGNRAMSQFASAASTPEEQYSTLATLALCWLELGDEAEARGLVAQATGPEVRDVSALLDSATYCMLVGDNIAAEALIERAGGIEGLDETTRFAISGLRDGLALAQGRASYASTTARVPRVVTPLTVRLSFQFFAALRRLASGEVDEAARLASSEAELAFQQGGARALARLDIVIAAAQSDSQAMRIAIDKATGSGEGALLEAAEAVAYGLDLLDDVPQSVRSSIERFPRRWLPTLRRQLDRGRTAGAVVAARLLSEYGETADGPRLQAFERTYLRRSEASRLAKALAVRVSAPLRVQDLGPVTLTVGPRQTLLTQARRKAAALLSYLVTRPHMSATREQVLNDLWPDSTPEAAANSLNQTLYFLRREIDPWYEEEVAADYVHYRSELVWLDSRLVTADSITFDKAVAALRTSTDPDAAMMAIELYKGRFAPEFEYEEWAISWRDRLHSRYLSLVEQTGLALVERRRTREAIEVLHRALAIDSNAIEFERRLVALYASVGARAAAVEQYRHFAAACRTDLGVEPPPFELVATSE